MLDTTWPPQERQLLRAYSLTCIVYCTLLTILPGFNIFFTVCTVRKAAPLLFTVLPNMYVRPFADASQGLVYVYTLLYRNMGPPPHNPHPHCYHVRFGGGGRGGGSESHATPSTASVAVTASEGEVLSSSQCVRAGWFL